MEELIKQYLSLAKSYLNKLESGRYLKSDIVLPRNSPFKAKEDYLNYRAKSIHEIKRYLIPLISSLEKYNRFKTLNPKIVRSAKQNALINSQFYDHAVGLYNFVDPDPGLYALINNHYNKFHKLSKRIEQVKKQ